MLKYILRVFGPNRYFELEIGENRFAELKEAHNTLSQALDVETKYEIVVRNYLAFEKELIGIVIDSVGRRQRMHRTFFEQRTVANVAILNLLNSAKFYTETLPENVENCLQDKEKSSDIEEVIKGEKSNNAHFSFVCDLRNYIQHIGLPTHKTVTGLCWGKDNLQENYMRIFSLKKHLLNDPKARFDEVDEEVNLVLAIRHYIESVSKIHIRARNLVEKKVTVARKCVKLAIDESRQSAFGSDSNIMDFDLCALRLNGALIEDKFNLLLDLDDIRLELIAKNKLALSNLAQKYATTKGHSEQ